MIWQAPERHEPSSAIFSKFNVALVILAVLTFGLGIVGFWFQGISGDGARCPERADWWFLDPLYRTIALFEFAEANLQIPECYDHVVLAIARFTGPATTILFIALILLEFLREPFDRLRLGLFRRHTVVLGFGEQGQVRAHEAAASGSRVVALEKSPSEERRAVARRDGIVLTDGDAGIPQALDRARVDRAKNVVIATGDDAQNLLIAQRVAGRFQGLPPSKRTIDVAISDPLIRRALDRDAAAGLIDVFSVEDVSVFKLCEVARFFEIADLLGQPCIHIVMVGFGRIGASAFAQILRSSTIADLDRTRISILTPDPAAARDLLRLSYPGAEEVADVAYFTADPMRITLDEGAMMGEVEAVAPVTAVLALCARSFDAVPAVLAIREAVRRSRYWHAPLFFGVEHAESLVEISCRIDTAKRYSEVLHPFEVSAHLCTREAGEERDRIAQTIHQAYLDVFEQMRKEGARPTTAEEALVPWDRLKPTFLQANRRVADHIPAKLASAGCVVPAGPPSVPPHFDLLEDSGTLERLADLEHRVWAIDRQLDGWRLGEFRDDARRIYDCLKPYADLPEPTKDLDRAQVREIGMTLRGRAAGSTADAAAPLVRFDLWVALTGSRALDRHDAEWFCEMLTVRVLPRLFELHPEHNITLLSPLAPGAELIAAKAALGCLVAHKRQHRLLAVEAVVARQAVEDFQSSWAAGAVGDLDLTGAGRVWPEVRRALLAAVEAVVKGPACERVLDLDAVDPGASLHERQSGYRRGAGYLVQRAHVVIAAVEPPGAALPGDIGEAVAWRRDPASIPEDVPCYRQRPNSPAQGCPSLILIDADARRVSEEPAAS